MKSDNLKSKSFKNRPICFQCATPIPTDEDLVCPKCGSADIDLRRARPRKEEYDEAPPLETPWDKLSLHRGGTVLLSGNAGSGKTSITLKLKPTRVISTEQEIKEVARAWYRINGDQEAPLITNCHDWDELYTDIADVDENDLVIVDSVSQLAESHETGEIVRQVIEQIRSARARAIFIVQFRKDGMMLGPNELRHMVDAVATIPDDRTGLRRLSMEKNRFGPLYSTYFALTADGVGRQEFINGYSVEGPAGNYELRLFPMPGAKYTGILQVLSDAGAFLEGKASAAIACRGYRSGFAEPTDVEWRRKFAEDHGLEWIGPKEAYQILTDLTDPKKEDLDQ